jgi:hypothetical protein
MIKSIKNLNLPFVAELLFARSKKQEARSKGILISLLPRSPTTICLTGALIFLGT